MSIVYQKISGNAETLIDFHANAADQSIKDNVNSYDYTYGGSNFDDESQIQNIQNVDVSLKRNTFYNRQYCFVNIHATDSVTVDFYIKYVSDYGTTRETLTTEESTDYTESPEPTLTSIYYLKNVVIPNGATLKVEKGDIVYPTYFQNEYVYLYIKLNASDSAVDLITTNY